MSFSIKKISTPLGQLRRKPSSGPDLTKTYDVIVVGSGYGGAISAAKLTLAGRKVLLLERGREILPGDYPRALQDVQAETQITTAQGGKLTKINGMLDIRLNDDMSVVVGCGLGGTSLINANVAIEADARVFEQTETLDGGQKRRLWPTEYAASDDPPVLEAAYKEAARTLGTNPLPDKIKLHKLDALETSAKAMGQPYQRADINVTFTDSANALGNYQAACTLCGDCCSGCNYGAKNTTLMNYLPFASANGADIVTEASVAHVSQGADDLWVVRVTEFDQPPKDGLDIKAKMVVLAAGTLGSTEILKRSAANGLALSDHPLGSRFSSNGDVLSFGFDANYTHAMDTPQTSEMIKNTVQPIYSVGAGTHSPDEPRYQPGPCIAGLVKVNSTPDDPLESAILIEEGVAPGALSMVYPAVLFMQDVVNNNLMAFPDAQRRLDDVATLGNDLLSGQNLGGLAYEGATARMQSYLLMSHDDSGGRIVYDDRLDIVSVSWPGAGQNFPFPRNNAVLDDASQSIWANYVPNPVWSEPFGWKLVAAHPLGGCPMADGATYGVVNGLCQVFTGVDETSVYDNLMVCDGAVIPTALGVNPLLTISAVTIHTMDGLIKRNGWYRDGPAAPAHSTSNAPVPQPVTPDPFAAMRDDLVAALAYFQSYKVLIDQGHTTRAKTDISAWFVDTFGGSWSWQVAKAFYYADMSGDIGPALGEVIKDVQVVLKAIAPGSSKTIPERAAALVVALQDIIGDISSTASFTETMEGAVAAIPARPHPISSAYKIGAKLGQAEGATLNGDFTITTDDVDAMMVDPAHRAALTGTIEIGAASGKIPQGTFDLSNGCFELLTNDGTEIDKWLMNYSGDFGDGLVFKGHKILQRREGSNWWSDLTTLDVDILTKGTSHSPEQLLGQGRMTLGVQDFTRQMLTLSGYYVSYVSENDILQRIMTAVQNTELRALLDKDFNKKVDSKPFLQSVFRHLIVTYFVDENGNPLPELEALAMLADTQGPMLFARLIFQSYGGLAAYLYNYPRRARTEISPMPPTNGGTVKGFPTIPTVNYPATVQGAKMQLTRFKGGTKGPLIIANGIGFRGMAFALDTTKQSFVQKLLGEGYDVWVFDHRASPANKTDDGEVNKEYTVDDLAKVDWPWAIDFVRAKTGSDTVQLMAHCFGGLTAMMSLAGGYAKNVRQMVVSQFSLHPVTNWFNLAKADTDAATLIHTGLTDEQRMAIQYMTGSQALADLFEGREIFDLNTTLPPTGKRTDAQTEELLINTLLWNAPYPSGEPCYSPTCHRVFGVFGPVYLHAQLEQATHNAISWIAGPVATLPFIQMAHMMQAGIAVDAKGKPSYLKTPSNLDFPIHFISGSRNELVMPETTLRTQRWLQNALPDKASQFTRSVFDGYGHLDCFIGRKASVDVFDDLLGKLNAANP